MGVGGGGGGKGVVIFLSKCATEFTNNKLYWYLDLVGKEERALRVSLPYLVDRGKSTICIFHGFKALASIVVIYPRKVLQLSVDHPSNIQPPEA